MRFLIVGLGSMGRRRIRNLQHLKAGEIIGFDPRVDRCDEVVDHYGVRTFTSFDDAMAVDPDALVISTPPDLHLQYERIAATSGKHFFSEVGVGTEGIDEIIDLTRDTDKVAAPSCTLRFHPLVQTIKDIVDSGEIGPILTFSSHSGQYLPDWHPWEDYRTFWASKRQTGACREQFVLEGIWLTWVLGPVREISCTKDKLTNLDTDIDDVYHMLVRLGDGVPGHLMLDVVSRVPYRGGRLFSEDGIVEWSLTEKRLQVYSGANREWRDCSKPDGPVEAGYIHAEQMYIAEMQRFLQAVRGEEQWPYSLADNRRIQEALEAADRSAETGQRVTL